MSQPSFDFGDDEGLLDDGGVVTYGVGELAEAINGQLRRGFGDGVWVRGEIQGWSERGQHAYFRLAEAADGAAERSRATISVQFFGSVRMRLRPLLQKHRLRLGDGMKVRIFGHLDFFAPSGQLGLKMSGIDPRFTLGELAVQRDQVVRRLVASGLFDANRGRRLAVAPLRVGVVTSVGSAAWADFTHELERSGYAFAVHVVDVRVQGDVAVEMVSGAVRWLGRRPDLDVVVVVRGGGSRTELATFDDERIATAIATCPLPVLTGLGHEIDRSVADDVAHLALKTPTACAAALVERVGAYVGVTERVWSAIASCAERDLVRAGSRLTDASHAIARRSASAVTRADDRLGQRASRLRERASGVLDRADAKLGRAAATTLRAPQRLDAEERHLGSLEAHVRLLDPVNVLARGWSITRDRDGRAVRDAAALAPGDVLTTTFAAGSATSRVQATHPSEEEIP